MFGAWEKCFECNITNGKGRKFTKDDLIYPFYICTIIEDDMGCQKLGLRVH
jgi:hypothetical protein